LDPLLPDAGDDGATGFDLRRYLLGAWTLTRTMTDRSAGSHGTFTGVVHFTATDDGGLHYREKGTVHWDPAGGTRFTGPASREYLLRPAATPETMDMVFPDGRPFHRIGFGARHGRDGHWCDPDTYRVEYTKLGADAFRFRWDVTGPAKDLLLESVLRRTPGAGRAGAPVNANIVVSAVCVYDAAGRLLTVRKRGTDKFMQPGGKPEPGESAAQAASRELAEEVGVIVAADELEPLGSWLAEAANEAATQIEATVFVAPGTWSARAAAEIAEVRWLDLTGPTPEDLAPLLTDHVLPLLAARAARAGRRD
jgi:8-oxo-dGTP pyrophosphatase MutT (NUDIX family)